MRTRLRLFSIRPPLAPLLLDHPVLLPLALLTSFFHGCAVNVLHPFVMAVPMPDVLGAGGLSWTADGGLLRARREGKARS